MEFNSKYTNAQIENMLDSISNTLPEVFYNKQIEHGTSDTTFTLTPNVLHVWGTVTSLKLTFGNSQDGAINEYLFQFTSGSTATSLTISDAIKWANDSAPTIAKNKIYQISVINGLATVLEFNA